MLRVNVAVIEAKKIRHVSSWLQKDEP